MEKKFETSLAIEVLRDGVELEKVFRHDDWGNVSITSKPVVELSDVKALNMHIKQLQDALQETFACDMARHNSPIPPELIA